MSWLTDIFKKKGNSILDHNRTWAKQVVASACLEIIDYVNSTSKVTPGMLANRIYVMVPDLVARVVHDQGTTVLVTGIVMMALQGVINQLDLTKPAAQVAAQITRLRDEAYRKIDGARF